MTAPLRLALVDDEEMVRTGLATWLTRADPSVRVEIATGSWLELLADTRFPVDVVLLDLDLRDDLPAEVKIVTLRTAGVPCVIVSTHASGDRVRSCITAGARGYLPKSESPLEILLAVRAVAAGDSYLSPVLAGLLVSEPGTDRSDVPRLSPQELRVDALRLRLAHEKRRHEAERRLRDGQELHRPGTRQIPAGRARGADKGRPLPPGRGRRLHRSTLNSGDDTEWCIKRSGLLGPIVAGDVPARSSVPLRRSAVTFRSTDRP